VKSKAQKLAYSFRRNTKLAVGLSTGMFMACSNLVESILRPLQGRLSKKLYLYVSNAIPGWEKKIIALNLNIGWSRYEKMT